MTAPTALAAGRIKSLDTMRGIAILMVVGSHFAPQIGLPATPAVIGIGRGGVILFFLLSGYLIFRNIQRQPVPTFTMRRLFKILPSFWLNLFCLLLVDLSTFGVEHHSTFDYVTNFLMISDFWHRQPINGLYWTLLIEVKFYLFIALQYAVLGNRHLPAVVGGLLTFSLLCLVIRGHGSLLLAFFPVFYIGAYIYLAEEAGWTAPALGRLAVIMLATAAGVLITAADQRIPSTIYTLGASALLAFCLWRGLGWSWLGFLGMTSYSNYLYHGMVLTSVFAVFGVFAPGASATLKTIVAFASTLGLAAILYWSVEQPFVRFGRRQERFLAGRFRPEPALAARDPAAP